jgi:hypothetical protein
MSHLSLLSEEVSQLSSLVIVPILFPLVRFDALVSYNNKNNSHCFCEKFNAASFLCSLSRHSQHSNWSFGSIKSQFKTSLGSRFNVKNWTLFPDH